MLRFVLWWVVLWIFFAPARDLGGILDELTRWLERFLPASGLIVGWTVGSRAEGWRWACYPPTLVVALLLVIVGDFGAVRVTVLGWLGYIAGFDQAYAAYPAMMARASFSVAPETGIWSSDDGSSQRSELRPETRPRRSLHR